MKKNLILMSLVLGGVIIVGLYFYQQSLEKKVITEKPTEGIISPVMFSCAENKSVRALFFKDKVELTLSDSRNMLLVQAISASGARYANNDESFVFWNKGDTAFIEEKGVITFKDCVVDREGQKPAPIAQMANPASMNCTKVGGNLVIEKRGDGGEYGLCYFEDNRACEEWALFRKECPVGGRRTTGYDSIDQKYCAWFGGETFATPNSVCTFKNGKKCSTLSFYNGTCTSSQ
jgi:putative hemolysin